MDPPLLGCMFNSFMNSFSVHVYIQVSHTQENITKSVTFMLSSTVVPVFRGLCDQGTPAVSGQYNDVRGDFQYKLTLDQGTPANADADRHLFVIFAPQPGDSALFILFFITLGRKRYHTGSQTLSNIFANAHSTVVPATSGHLRFGAKVAPRGRWPLVAGNGNS